MSFDQSNEADKLWYNVSMSCSLNPTLSSFHRNFKHFIKKKNKNKQSEMKMTDKKLEFLLI